MTRHAVRGVLVVVAAVLVGWAWWVTLRIFPASTRRAR